MSDACHFKQKNGYAKGGDIQGIKSPSLSTIVNILFP